MKFAMSVVAALALAGVSGCASKTGESPSAARNVQVTPKVIDVRSAEEFEEGHIEGAANIPVKVVEAKIGEAVPDKSAPVWVYCQGGGRSARAATTLKNMGYTNVRDLGSYSNAQAVASAELK